MNQKFQPPRSLLLLQVTVLLVGCGVIASIWRLTDLADARDRQVLAEQKRFHTESIMALTQLATNAGLLTSADLCPVRFRLRMGNGHSVPFFASGQTRFRLWTCAEARRECVMQSWMDTAGVIDFGLNPPGSYQLELRTPDGMFLTHDFEVLPGVPIDRVVHCPQSSQQDDVIIQLDVDWPAVLDGQYLIAVCLVEPAPFIDGEWNWQPALHWEPLRVVTVADAPALVTEIANQIGVPEWELRPADEFAIPFLYCQIREIAFFIRDTDPVIVDPMCTHVVTARFRGAVSTGEQTADLDTVANLELKPLHFSTASRYLKIELPRPVVDLLGDRMALDRVHPAASRESL